MFETHEIKGVIPMELPIGNPVMAEFELNAAGEFVLRFTSYELGADVMHLAIRNNLIMLNLSYAAAMPAEPTEMEKVRQQWKHDDQQKTSDYMPSLGEDVRSHAMETGFEPHADGRQCSYHVRLGKYTPDGLNECLRVHIKNGV